MKRAKTMSTITVELTIKVKTKYTPSNAEKTKWIHLTPRGKFSHPLLRSIPSQPQMAMYRTGLSMPRQLADTAKASPANT